MTRIRSACVISRRLKRSRKYEEREVKGSENGMTYELSEIFSIDEEDKREMDMLVDMALRRGYIKGRSV